MTEFASERRESFDEHQRPEGDRVDDYFLQIAT
jgi:hypothetical protein